ncbi:hypothetical protein CFOL_v3_07139 [Cephalotus follicularis]|uniref:Uncharacterized protein n=1 Tax=Cephalotus follicularis TaxID=3775 RepID=A0A1Q3B6G4_CEPFO|nr:hypothetical protein CFOL_v3_07139 [Cephalotus follicularis]
MGVKRMGTKTPKACRDRENWDAVFNGLVKMLETQQEQLKTLVKQREIIQDRIKEQHERFESDIRLYEDRISQMKSELEAQKMTCVLEAAKSDLIVSMRLRESYISKLKLECTDDELIDLKLLCDIISQNPQADSIETDNGKKVGGDNNLKSSSSEKLAGEVRRLKRECKKLVSEKGSEVSALLAEKKFIWNQYRVLEDNLTDKLKSKQAEVEVANEKIATLLASIEKLQSSNNEKDEAIVRLTAKVSKMEADANKWGEEISRLSRELELLRKSRSASVTPLLNRCRERARSSNLGGIYSGSDRSNVVVKKESSMVQVSDPLKGSRTLKRKVVDNNTILETPTLFSSAFKVPKVKDSSLRVR